MYSAESFIHAYSKESSISIQLYHKMPQGALDYRPALGQRSTAELLRYLSYGPYNVVRRILAGDWKVGRPANEATKDMPASDFPRNMRWQGDEVARLVRAVNSMALEQDDFTFPWGETMKKGEALVNQPLRWLTGYRMQLFLYLKAAGAKELGTKDLWHLS